jgi:hypothetical protein
LAGAIITSNVHLEKLIAAQQVKKLIPSPTEPEDSFIMTFTNACC